MDCGENIIENGVVSETTLCDVSSRFNNVSACTNLQITEHLFNIFVKEYLIVFHYFRFSSYYKKTKRAVWRTHPFVNKWLIEISISDNTWQLVTELKRMSS